jgi:hypothetical protein
MVVDEMEGVVKDVPVPNDVPPVGTEYQLIVPAVAVAPRVTCPGPMREFGLTPLIVATIAVTPILADVQPL